MGVFTVRRIWKAVFLGFKHDLETEDVYEDTKLLTSSDGAIVGWATVSRDERWRPATAVLGPLLPSQFRGRCAYSAFGSQIPLSRRFSVMLIAVLKRRHPFWRHQGSLAKDTLKNQFAYSGQDYDVLVFGRG